jgi:hypothetical protein
LWAPRDLLVMLLHRVRLQLAIAFGVFCVGLAVTRSRRRRPVRAPQAAATPAAPQPHPPAAAAATAQPPTAPATEPARATGAPAEPRPRGAAVLVQNLKSKPEFNGREGRVLEYDGARGRYSVRLLQSGAIAPRTLQVKPENLADAPAKNARLSAPELCLLTLSEHAAVSATQMEGVIELLSSGQAGQQLTEADLSLLLRVVCCFGWHVASHRDRATGEETPALLPHPEHGSGLML